MSAKLTRFDYRDKENWPPGLWRRGKWFHYERRGDGEKHKFSLRTTDLHRAISLVVKHNQRLEITGHIDRQARRKSIVVAAFLEAMREHLAHRNRLYMIAACSHRTQSAFKLPLISSSIGAAPRQR